MKVGKLLENLAKRKRRYKSSEFWKKEETLKQILKKFGEFYEDILKTSITLFTKPKIHW